MTDEELDALASSYLDGEATPEEVALVERDSTLMARVHELRQVQALLRAPVQAPQELKDQQLTAALAEFSGDRRATLSVFESDRSTGEPPIDITGDDSVPPVVVPVGVGAEAPAVDAGSDVIDLRSRQSRRRPDNRMRWLSAAAGFLVFGFGAVFLAGQMNSADNGADEAAVAAADDSADAIEESESFEGAADDGAAAGAAIAADDAAAEAMADSDAAMESEEMSADAEEPLAVTDSADDTGADEEAAEESADGAGGPPIIFDDVPDSGFFPNEPAVGYSNVPSSDEIVGNLDLRWRQPESAQCAARVSLQADAEVIGHLPIEVTNPDGTTAVVEALYIVTGPDFEVILVDPDSCALF